MMMKKLKCSCLVFLPARYARSRSFSNYLPLFLVQIAQGWVVFSYYVLFCYQRCIVEMPSLPSYHKAHRLRS